MGQVIFPEGIEPDIPLEEETAQMIGTMIERLIQDVIAEHAALRKLNGDENGISLP